MLSKQVILIAIFRIKLIFAVCTNDHIIDINLNLNEDADLDVPSIIKKYGYHCEIYDVTTEDGYIVQLHRIPYGKNRNLTLKNVPVIVQHGLLASSADFLLSGPGKALAYVLADAGYDVWLVNSRGNRYSQKHVILNPQEDSKYWRFSWHEMGIYDLPATIDFVLNATKRSQLFHVGYSQGATTFFVMGSERTRYLDKIIAHFSYAPAAYMKYMHSPIFLPLSKFTNLLQYLLQSFEINALPSSKLLNNILTLMCSNQMVSDVICSNAIFAIYGYNKKELNNTVISAFAGHMPAGASIDQVLHYGQLVNSHRFCQYDYGFMGNWKRYRAVKSPNYNLTKINVPVYVFYSVADWFTDHRDVKRLRRELPNVTAFIEMEDTEWMHLDFLFGLTAKTKIYDKTIAFMKEHESLPLN